MKQILMTGIAMLVLATASASECDGTATPAPTPTPTPIYAKIERINGQATPVCPKGYEPYHDFMSDPYRCIVWKK